MKKYSIEDNIAKVLKPNSQFERRIILQYYLDNDILISDLEREVLTKTVAVEAESIGIIGCLLNDSTHLNTLRLAIGSKNKSNKKLANFSQKLLNSLNLDEADTYFLVDKNPSEMSEVEKDVESVYSLLYY